jgi:hypothetical protein
MGTLGVVKHFHVLQRSFCPPYLGFRDKGVVTVRKVYTECNARFR